MISISIFIGTCLGIITLALARQIWSRKAAKARSLSGVTGIRVFIDLIKLTQQHRGVHSGFLNGKQDFQEKLYALEKDINKHYSDLILFEKHHSYPSSLSVSYPFKQWQRIINHTSIQSAESFRFHSGLIARQLDAVWDMSDEFSLTSNQHENIRHRAEQLVKTLPELAEALGQIRALSVQVAAKNDISSDKKLQLLFTLGKIEDYQTKLTTPLPPVSNQQLTQFVSEIKESAQNQHLSTQDPDLLFNNATQVIDEIYTVIYAGFESLKTTISEDKSLF